MLTTFPFTPGFVHGTTAAYAVDVHRFGDQSEQRYLRSATPRASLRYEFTYPSSSLVAQVVSFFLGMGGPEQLFAVVDHRTRETHPARFAASAVTHTRGGVVRGLALDFLLQSTLSLIPVATAYTQRSSVDWCDGVTAGSGVIFPPPGPPAPFLGLQAPEGAGWVFWGSVTSHALSGGGWMLSNQLCGPAIGAAFTTMVNQQIVAVPIIAPQSVTLSTVGAMLTGAAGAGTIGHFGVYVAWSNTNHYPSSLLTDCGTTSFASTGLRAVTTSASLLPNHLYFLALCVGSHVSGIIRAHAFNTEATPLLGVSSTSDTWTTFRFIASNAVGLPAQFPQNLIRPIAGGGADAFGPALGYRVR